MRTLAVDMGTSSCKAGVFAIDGLACTASREYDIISRHPGYAELDADAVWAKIMDAMREVVRSSGGGSDIAAVSFSSIGEAFVPVAADGTVTGPSIMAYDCRGDEYLGRLRSDFGGDEFYAINPNFAGPQYSLPKLMWFRDYEPERYASTAKFFLWADYLAWKMGARPHTSNSLANRTLLFDIAANDWSGRLMDWSGLDRDKFPPIVRGGEAVGTVGPAIARELGLRPDALIVAGGHDQCCNALGSGCIAPGMAVVGMGTYESYCPVFSWPKDRGVLFREGMSMESHVVDGLFVSFLHHHSGLLVNWFRRTFAPNETPPAGMSVYDVLNGELPGEPSGLLFLPHNEPVHWPRFRGDTAGAFIGMKTATGRGEMFRALLEGITFFFVGVTEAMGRAGVMPREFLASGGGSRSDAWMQIRADIIGVPFTRLGETEGTLIGASMLAAMAAGMFPDLRAAVAASVRLDRTFEPIEANRRRYRELYALYKRIDVEAGALIGDLRRFDM